ncbi:hypothetical protein JOQ06_020903 [Pogonophryne albipinna]|uniref:Zinc finger PHD-type domain-containing protein n=1 Tax=Pogonophryne albipinna TaxID=1090488 RepID=A0AAD6BR95_9TELE|nr:hypothetical protein JOQ06_020903 [Pogonophryne albipinna]
MLTNEHSIPPITFWLMQFLRKLSQYTNIKVHQGFRFLFKAEVMEGNPNVDSATHLLCTPQSIGRRTADKGLKEFATFAFARLQNATSMTTALNIFRSLCTVFIGKHNSNTVLIHLKAMKDFIKECRIPDMEEGDKLGDSPFTQEEDDEERRNAHTAVGRSPFTYEFRKVMEEYLHALSNHMYVVAPLQGSNEVEDSRKAGYKCGEYFKMRRNRLGKEDWVSIKGQPGKITHTFQKDATISGAFVMQMAEMTDGFCSFCGTEDLPTTAVDAVWIQCETCGRWFHTQCLGMTAARIPKKDPVVLCVVYPP